MITAFRWCAALAWSVLLFVAVWGPPPTREPLFAHEDKVFHLCAFGGMAAAWLWALGRRRPAVLIAVIAAALSEVGQAYLPWPRSADLLDFVADVVGVALGVFVATQVIAWMPPWLAGPAKEKGAPRLRRPFERSKRDSNPR